MELTKDQKLRPAIEALKITEFVDLPKDAFTASAARQAVNRIGESDTILACDSRPDEDTHHPRTFRVSETAYPGGTRVTRLA